MDQDDPEKRIADLERQLAEQKRMPERERQPAEAVNRRGVTPEQVHNVAFSDASRSQGAYHRDEVDAFLSRVEAALRDPTATGGVTPPDIDNVAFSKPPIGQRGYNEREVDAFLDLVKIGLTHRVPGQGPEQPIRIQLYRLYSRDQTTPALAIELDKDAVRVIDLKSNALLASASLTHVTARPAEYGGGPVVIVDVPGLQPLTIQPHLIAGFSRRGESGRLAGRVPRAKAKYLVLDEDWFPLVEIFDVAPDLENQSTPRKIYNHIADFVEALQRPGFTWQWFLTFGMLLVVPACIYWSPKVLAFGVISLILAALAWHFRWGQLD